MSGRKEKKIRQLYRRDIRSEMQKRVDALIPQVSKLLKPAPRYFPKRLRYKLSAV